MPRLAATPAAPANASQRKKVLSEIRKMDKKLRQIAALEENKQNRILSADEAAKVKCKKNYDRQLRRALRQSPKIVVPAWWPPVGVWTDRPGGILTPDSGILRASIMITYNLV